MTILTRLEKWRQEGSISPEQYDRLADLIRGEPFSLFLELNLLLYAGVITFVAGLGWTVSTWSKQIGDVLILVALSAPVPGIAFRARPRGLLRRHLRQA